LPMPLRAFSTESGRKWLCRKPEQPQESRCCG
jgi:hypothetical protein